MDTEFLGICLSLPSLPRNHRSLLRKTFAQITSAQSFEKEKLFLNFNKVKEIQKTNTHTDKNVELNEPTSTTEHEQPIPDTRWL